MKIKLTKLFTLLLLLLTSKLVLSDSVRLLLVGDSWSRQQFTSNIHQNVFEDNNLSYILVEGSTTAISGSTTNSWTTANRLQLITDAFISKPTINTVQVTLGGNDILGQWNADLTSQQENDLLQQIQSNLGLIINHILAINPNIEVVLSFYDYPNFEDTLDKKSCNNRFNNMSQPTSAQINSIFISFEQLISQLSNSNPRVYHVSHFGILQNFYGFIDDGIAPSVIPLPGDTNLPSPPESLRLVTGGLLDCIHLSNQSYTLLIQNLFDNYYNNRFSNIFSNGFE